jgi:uncharacterized protein YcfJ
MNTSRKTASVMGGGLKGAGVGATVGTAIAPGPGSAIGAGVGALVGGAAGYFGAQADEDEMNSDPDYLAAQRREKAQKLMSAALGRAFAAVRPSTTQGAQRNGL